jgi:hypothetical protein
MFEKLLKWFAVWYLMRIVPPKMLEDTNALKEYCSFESYLDLYGFMLDVVDLLRKKTAENWTIHLQKRLDKGISDQEIVLPFKKEGKN